MIEHDYYLLIPKKNRDLEHYNFQARTTNFSKEKVPLENVYTNIIREYYNLENIKTSDLSSLLMKVVGPTHLVVDEISRGGRMAARMIISHGIRPTAVLTKEGVIAEGTVIEAFSMKKGIVVSDLRVLSWAISNKVIQINNSQMVVLLTCHALWFVSYAVRRGVVSGVLAVPNSDIVLPEEVSNEVARIMKRGGFHELHR